MKYTINESKVNQIIYDYINDRYYPDYNWGPELHDFYRKDVGTFGVYNFEVDDKLAYRYYGEYDGYDYLYLLEVEDWIAKELSSIFNDLWIPIFIKWFEDGSGLEVKDFEIGKNFYFQENINRIKEMMGVISESDPKVGTGKKPEGSDRRLYTDENPSDTVSVKFRTKQDIIDTLNKESFKSKSHARQSQIINLIHQRLRVALERAKDPEVKKRLRTAFEYIESKKEESKRKTQDMKEGLHDTSWENEGGDKVTLMDLLNATEDIPVENISVEELKPHLLTWDDDEDEVKKIDKADLKYPILIFVNDDGEFISIIDGHHRAQKAVRKELKTIKAKVIPIDSLPKGIRKVFSHMN